MSIGLVGLPNRMLEVRKAQGISQAKCAAILDVSDRSYKSYELGKREAPLSVVIKFCEKFNVDINWLVFGDENQNLPQMMPIFEKTIKTVLDKTREDTKQFSNEKILQMALYVFEQSITEKSDPEDVFKAISKFAL